MSATRVPTFVAVALLVSATSVAAQPASHPAGPRPVSPGSFTKAALAAACPSFSWAPVQWAAGYELTVFAIERGELAAAPALRVNLPGTASSWTPPADECLRAGTEYTWFVRETDAAGDPLGPWSNGMRFRVLPAASRGASGGRDTEPAIDSLATVGASGEEARGGSGAALNDKKSPPPTNREILARLDEVLAILNAPEPAFSFALCSEPAFQVELEGGQQMRLDGMIEGRVGAEGFGNGAMVRLQGEPAAVFEGGFKGAWDILKFGVCWDVGATVRNRRAAAAAAGANALAALDGGGDLADVVAGLDLADIQAKLQAMADTLNLDPKASLEAIQALGDLPFDDGPFGALREDGIFQQLAGHLPLPDGLRNRLQNPGALVARLQELRQQGLCSLDLPPALSGPVGEICGLIANEPYSKLLTRVDNTVGTVRATVGDIKGVVDNIRGRLPVEGDCKLFCK